MAYGQSCREDVGVAVSLYDVVFLHFSVPRYVVEVRYVAVALFPDERAEKFGLAQSAACLAFLVEQRDYDALVLAGHVDYTYHSLSAYDSHLWAYAVGFALVDGHEVVLFVQAAVDDLRVHEVIACGE